MKTHKHLQLLVFDFDGTMAESLAPMVERVNRWAGKFGRTSMTEQSLGRWLPQENESRFGWGWLYRRATEVGLTLVEQIQRHRWRRIQAEPRLMNVLTILRRQGYRLAIVTTNKEENVREFLTAHGWDWLFSTVYADGGLYGKGTLLEQLLEHQAIAPKHVVYVGDEPRDVLAAKEAGVRSVAVTWGYQPRESFQRVQPEWIIDRPEDLLRVVGMPRWRRVVAALLGR